MRKYNEAHIMLHNLWSTGKINRLQLSLITSVLTDFARGPTGYPSGAYLLYSRHFFVYIFVSKNLMRILLTQFPFTRYFSHE